MLRHYLMTAVRGLLRHKLYSFINVAGFSIGLAAAILIGLYVRDQLLLAWPIAYWCMHRWLEGYTDRITLGPLYFLAAGAAALVIAWATVYANTLRVARANPVHALRYE